MREIKIKLFRSLILSLVLLVTIFVVAFSWFTQNSKANAEGINIECSIPDGVEIALVAPGTTPKAGDWRSDGNFITLNKDNFSFLENLNLSEITSDGVTFIRPALIQSGGKAYPDTEAENWDVAAANSSYLSFDLYIRSKATHTISLTNSSKFTTETDYSELSGENAGNKSTSGSFSRDCIVGAARFSVVNAEGDRELLWIPRPDIMLSQDSDGNFSIKTDISDDSSESYKHKYYDSNRVYQEDTEVVTSAKNNNNEYTLKTKRFIMDLNEPDGDFYINHVTCNMWIEGEDSEARLALVNGNFKIYLDRTIN